MSNINTNSTDPNGLPGWFGENTNWDNVDFGAILDNDPYYDQSQQQYAPPNGYQYPEPEPATTNFPYYSQFDPAAASWPADAYPPMNLPAQLYSVPEHQGHTTVDPRLMQQNKSRSSSKSSRRSEPLFVDQHEDEYQGEQYRIVHPTDEVHPGERTGSKSTASSRCSSANRSTTTSGESSDASLKKHRRPHYKKTEVQKLQPEKPKPDEDKPWIRVNGTTKGLTTRSTKNNLYDPKNFYDHKLAHPIGDWSGPKTEFKYTKHGELQERSYTPKQIKEFIMHYPKDIKGAELKIWIQKAGADSARRYPSDTMSRCRFSCCPAREKMNKATIVHGSYRVAFDEKWHKYRENNDPLWCCAYFHLYCFERFLDLPEICRIADVEVDRRSLASEPRAKFASSLAGSAESQVALAFVEAAKRNRLDEEFPDYPRHAHYRRGEPKDYPNTLCYQMNVDKESSRPPAQIKQFEARGLKPSHNLIHRGDLEMYVAGRLSQRTPKKKRKRGSDTEVSDADGEHEVEEFPQPPRRKPGRPPKKAKQTHEQVPELLDEDEHDGPSRIRSRHPKKTRIGYRGEGSDDDGFDVEIVPGPATTPPSRRSARAHKPVKYNENNLYITPDGQGPVVIQQQPQAPLEAPQAFMYQAGPPPMHYQHTTSLYSPALNDDLPPIPDSVLNPKTPPTSNAQLWDGYTVEDDQQFLELLRGQAAPLLANDPAIDVTQVPNTTTPPASTAAVDVPASAPIDPALNSAIAGTLGAAIGGPVFDPDLGITDDSLDFLFNDDLLNTIPDEDTRNALYRRRSSSFSAPVIERAQAILRHRRASRTPSMPPTPTLSHASSSKSASQGSNTSSKRSSRRRSSNTSKANTGKKLSNDTEMMDRRGQSVGVDADEEDNGDARNVRFRVPRSAAVASDVESGGSARSRRSRRIRAKKGRYAPY